MEKIDLTLARKFREDLEQVLQEIDKEYKDVIWEEITPKAALAKLRELSKQIRKSYDKFRHE